MSFEEALSAMKIGNRVRRTSWPPGDYLRLEGDQFTVSVGDFGFRERDWIETTDILGDDWELVVG